MQEPYEVKITADKYPEYFQHLWRAWAKGYPHVLTLIKDQELIKKHRRASTRKLPSRHSYDRDEYPMACTAEGGAGADVVYMSPHDNRGAGAFIAGQLKDLPEGTKFEIVFI